MTSRAVLGTRWWRSLPAAERACVAAPTQDLCARFELALDRFTLDVDLELPGSEVTALLGSSGSGKTTLLRCIAGLERRARGSLRFRGESWQGADVFVPAHQRPIGYVFQDAGLFPHLSVRKNLEFGLRSVASAARRIDFDQAVEMLGVGPLLSRSPGKLSGGERQRVAIARALLTSPRLLLMDEPLASLDLASRNQILPYFEVLDRELHVPIIYVTHAPAEAVRLARRIVWMDAGKVTAHGSVNEMLTHPGLPLAHASDAAAVLEARVIRHEPTYHLTHVEAGGGSLAISARALPLGACTRVRVCARDVSVSLAPPERSSIMNVLAAEVLDVHIDRDPAHRLVRICAGTDVLLARITHRSLVELDLQAGRAVFAHVKSAALVE